ncbi:Cation transporting ATPase C-terminus [Babesia microti strain RI]|uniref:P-type Ca(2+) transporter n=1 Tax=Babesia microti (strain RI) TaxID=1133968 RepID=A0A1N6LWH7_BABMR|nr:Cation transporting ATPase C-terminus [Babesia microti strain RI]SIO73219.1 Cation transporting ATPase C-terminus [Babesia microti strain RI]|eukprot:XP_021337327.1 Cation transporting ATPase C-terminus [Babesia microti strain RI]
MELPSCPHTLSVEDILDKFSVDIGQGLSQKQVSERREKYGYHVLHQSKGLSLYELIYAQFEDLLVRILLGAAVFSFVLTLLEGEGGGVSAYVEPIVIMVILVLNAFIGVWQECDAEKALDALKKLQPQNAKCLREGKWQMLETSELVPGDIVSVVGGNKVPADCRLIKVYSTCFSVEQSQLTGESALCSKHANALGKGMEECEIQERKNMIYSSTTVSVGNALAIVTATGMSTEIGNIQSAVMEAAAEKDSTPLQEKLDEFGAFLSKIISVICVLVWVINFRNFSDPVHGSFLGGAIYYFKIAISLAVAAIPEGLPAVITTCLALGTRKMAKQNAIVRKLSSVETLGCTTVICSDKTGTLTTNVMSVRTAIRIDDGDRVIKSKEGEKLDARYAKLIKCAVLCNNCDKEEGSGEEVIYFGEPTERALIILAQKNGMRLEYGESRLAELEFARDRKMMSTINKTAEGKQIIYSKGAPESILDRCTHYLCGDRVEKLTAQIKSKLHEEVDIMAKSALRTLAFAEKTDGGDYYAMYTEGMKSSENSEDSPAYFAKIECGLTFLGMVGIHDPPRKGVKEAIEICRNAGIKVIMITGDNKLTAEAIAKSVNIPFTNSFTGKEFESLPHAEKERVLMGNPIFSRTEPKHKQYIVSILKSLGETVAMTGDGVNDAPALKQADIGISMGISGTEVAKEASDMILADDNFSTIVSAVQEGRCIYNNMKAFIRYLISSNVGEVVSIFLTAALGIPDSLVPVQLLWVNLVTDGPPATALGFNPPDPFVMSKPPRGRNEKLIGIWTMIRYLVVGIYVGISTVGIFVQWYIYGISPNDSNTLVSFYQLANWSECRSWNDFSPNTIPYMTNDPCSYFTQGKNKASTLSLTVLVITEMLNACNALSNQTSLISMPPWTNPYLVMAVMSSIAIHCLVLYTPPLARIFGVVPLDIYDWIAVFWWSFPVVLIDELLKFISRNSWSGHIEHAIEGALARFSIGYVTYDKKDD